MAFCAGRPNVREVHTLLVDVWTNASAWLPGRYMITPDHVHFFAAHRDGTIEYENWIRYWKSQFTKRSRRGDCRWQIDHGDTRMRSAEKYEERWFYVHNNPVRHGLVKRAEDWPYQGEIHVLR